jgi:hypothetical protein
MIHTTIHNTSYNLNCFHILVFLLTILESMDFNCALSITVSSNTKLLGARGMRSAGGVCTELCPSGSQGCTSEDYITVLWHPLSALLCAAGISLYSGDWLYGAHIAHGCFIRVERLEEEL